MAGKTSNAKAPAHTLEESRYLQDLIDNRVPVRLYLVDESELEGTIEFYDARFLRITRENQPNLFVYKHEIKYLFELETEIGNELADEPDDARGNQIGEPRR